MALLDDRMLPQTLIAFTMIALLALILRWTFARDSRRTPPWPPADAGGRPDTDQRAETDRADEANGADLAQRPDAEPRGAGTVRTRAGAGQEDYGLLAPAARVETAAQADRLRSVLATAGIRATAALGADGRYRVLVFASELHRARRIAGSSGPTPPSI